MPPALDLVLGLLAAGFVVGVALLEFLVQVLSWA
jgi:hypothetical protein